MMLDLPCHFFSQGINILRELPRRESLIELHGVVDAGGGLIDGMLFPFIFGHNLGEMKAATSRQKEKWKAMIIDAMRFLHRHNAFWGDAKEFNIIINQEGIPILADFGGGFAQGWVEEPLSGTAKGDEQGVKRMLQRIDKLKTAPESIEATES